MIKKLLLILSIAIFYTACGSTSSIESSVPITEEKTETPEQKKENKEVPEKILDVNFYVNCPDTTSCLEIQVEFKATIENYDGVLHASFSTKTPENNISVLKDYIFMCTQLGYRCNSKPEINTKSDKSGDQLDIINEENLNRIIDRLFSENITELYAFYQ